MTTDATDKQLKTAYRMRSLQFHPDKPNGNTAAFQRIADAYQVSRHPPHKLFYFTALLNDAVPCNEGISNRQ